MSTQQNNSDHVAVPVETATDTSGKVDKAIHILRNPWGWSAEEMKQARLTICDAYEDMKDAYTNMRDFAESKGLDTATYSSDYFQSGINPDSPPAK